MEVYGSGIHYRPQHSGIDSGSSGQKQGSGYQPQDHKAQAEVRNTLLRGTKGLLNKRSFYLSLGKLVIPKIAHGSKKNIFDPLRRTGGSVVDEKIQSKIVAQNEPNVMGLSNSLVM